MMLAGKAPSDSNRSGAADVLIIDDDDGTLQTFKRLLALEGFRVYCASTGAQGVELATDIDFDVILVDLRLDDISGTDLVSVLHTVSSASLVLMSAFLTVPDVVEAMKRGAATAVEKPLNLEDLLAVVRSVRQKPAPIDRAATGADQFCNRLIAAPRSVVERWVSYVIRACDSTDADQVGDFKTLENWARRVGVSGSTLCESCRLLGIRPLDARDFARVLAALRSALAHRCAPEILLNISNRRVLSALSRKAGIDLASVAEPGALERFLRTQRMVPQGSEALRLIRICLAEITNEPSVRHPAR
jgi:DNA-binding response OmpR family regulator